MKKYLLPIILLAFWAAFPLHAEAKAKNAVEAAKKEAESKEYRERYKKELAQLSPEELVAKLNTTWPASHDGLRSQLKTGKNYLVVHAFEPAIALDFRKANGFRESLENELGLIEASGFDGVGHVFMGWHCQTDNGPVEGMAAMTGERNFQTAKLFQNGWGLASFLAIFTDGHLQPSSFLGKYDAVMLDHFDAHVTAIEVSQEVCGNAMSFVSEYAKHPKRPARNFGLGVDPRKFEGGGCGSFGVAVLEKSGLFGDHPIAQSFWRTLRPNIKLFGYGVPVPTDTAPFVLRTGRKKVAAPSVFLSFRGSWDSAKKSGGPELKLVDPELLQLSLKTMYRALSGDIIKSSPELGYQFIRSPIGKIRRTKKKVNVQSEAGLGIRQDYVDVPIDATFDAQANLVVKHTKLWLKENRYTGRIVKSGSGSAIVLDMQ